MAKNNLQKDPQMFDAFGIHIAIDEHQNTFDAVVALLLDKDAIKQHVKRVDQFERKHAQGSYLELLKAADKVSFDGMNFLSLIRVGRLDNVISVYASQTIVTIVTLFEVMLTDFLRCMFCSHPERMYDFVTLETNGTILRGKIELSEILQENNIDNLLMTLAARAAKTASQTSYRNNLEPLIRNLSKASNSKIDKSLIKKMVPYIEIRNQIVHEGLEEAKITSKNVFAAFGTLTQILQHFEQIAKKEGVPIAPIDFKELS